MKLERLQELLATLGPLVAHVEVRIVTFGYQLSERDIDDPGARAAMRELSAEVTAYDGERKQLRRRLTNQRRELRRLARREKHLLDKAVRLWREIDLLERLTRQQAAADQTQRAVLEESK